MAKTKFSEQQIKEMKESLIDNKIIDFFYEEEGDYFVMEFENGTETSFRLMADIQE